MPDDQTILITGGAGNLGTKLAAHLSAQHWCKRIILLDVVAPASLPPKTEALVADLGESDGAWRSAVEMADAVVHFAALNPYPNCSWPDAVVSFDMTSRLILAAAGRECRFVFASSNHVMGRYKEETVSPGALSTELPPLPGTRYIEKGVVADSPAYATSKLMGERLLLATCAAPAARMTGVALRIGWVQPGDNHPGSISADGLPFENAAPNPAPEAVRALKWFRDMWLSNGDFVQVFAAALRSDESAWPAHAVVLNAMSDNAGMPWDIETTRRLIGYAATDNAWALLGA